MKVLDRNNIQIEIWERGAGYTLASGSSSSAAAAVAHRLGLCDREISVHMPGGKIEIEIGDGFAIRMTGAVTKVADGRDCEGNVQHIRCCLTRPTAEGSINCLTELPFGPSQTIYHPPAPPRFQPDVRECTSIFSTAGPFPRAYLSKTVLLVKGNGPNRRRPSSNQDWPGRQGAQMPQQTAPDALVATGRAHIRMPDQCDILDGLNPHHSCQLAVQLHSPETHTSFHLLRQFGK
jgi:hypothetical protein